MYTILIDLYVEWMVSIMSMRSKLTNNTTSQRHSSAIERENWKMLDGVSRHTHTHTHEHFMPRTYWLITNVLKVNCTRKRHYSKSSWLTLEAIVIQCLIDIMPVICRRLKRWCAKSGKKVEKNINKNIVYVEYRLERETNLGVNVARIGNLNGRDMKAFRETIPHG